MFQQGALVLRQFSETFLASLYSSYWNGYLGRRFDVVPWCGAGERWVIDPAPRGVERVPLAEALGRVLAEDVRADVDVPAFDRWAQSLRVLRRAPARVHAIACIAVGGINAVCADHLGTALPCA